MNTPAPPEPELVENLDDEMVSWKGISNLGIPSHVNMRRDGDTSSVANPSPMPSAFSKGDAC